MIESAQWADSMKTLDSDVRIRPLSRGSFLDPPLVAYKRQRNIKDNIIKSSIPKFNTREQRISPGMKKCRNCIFCPYVLEGKKVSTSIANWNIVRSFNCETQKVVYMVKCKKQRCRNSDTYIPMNRPLVDSFIEL